MSIIFQCQQCHQEIEADDDMVDLKINCPKCGRQILIPSKQSNTPPPLFSPPPPYIPPENPSGPEPIYIPPEPASPLPRRNMGSSAPSEMSGLAVASMVLGILSMMGGWFWTGMIMPVLSLIFGHIALSHIRTHFPRLSGKGFAVTGLVLGYVSLALALAVMMACGSALSSLNKTMKEIQPKFSLPPVQHRP